MRDAGNTVGGRYAFAVELDDGQVLSELDVYWNEVAGRVRALRLIDHSNGRVLLDLNGYARYGFANEGIAAATVIPPGADEPERLADGSHLLSGKHFIGARSDGTADIVYVSLLGPEPVATHSQAIDEDLLVFSKDTFLDGVS